MCVRLRGDAENARLLLDRQERNGWRARSDCPPWPFTLPFDWRANPFKDANWRFQLGAWRPLDAYIGVHARAGDPAAYAFLVDAMLDWGRAESTGRSPRVFWGDMAAGVRAAKLAYMLSQPEFSTLRRGKRIALERLARLHLKRLRDPGFIAYSNHALAQIFGAAALCHVAPHWPEAEGGNAYLAGLTAQLLKTQFGASGVHLEHSPGYHFFALREFRRLADTGWIEDANLRRMIRRAEKAAPWFVFPDGLQSAVGDSSPAERPIRSLPAARRITGKFFREAGYAVVRGNWEQPPRRSPMLLVTCGHHSHVHKQADDLSFELYEFGRRVIVDTGKYSYSAGPMRDFSNSAAAHNAIDLLAERPDNGLAETPPSGGGLKGLRRARWGWLIEGAIERPAFGVAHRRRFLYRPGRWLVLLDQVTADRPRELAAWLHLHPRFRASPETDGWSVGRYAIRYLADHALEFSSFRGQEEPVQGWMARDYHRRVANDALCARWTGQGGRLATLIALKPIELPEIALTEDDFEVRWRGEPLVTSIPDRPSA